MNAYATEEEQLQLLTNWFKKYWIYIVLSIVLLFSTFFGRQYWIKSNADYLERSSVLYDEFQNSTDEAEQIKIANNLYNNYKSTVYGKVSALYLASLEVDAKNWNKAIEQYKWVYNNCDKWPELQIIAYENWVRSYLELKNNSQALDIINDLEKNPVGANNTDLVKTYPANYYNLKGDVLYANDNPTEALTAYNKALVAINLNPALAEQMAQFSNWITLKRNDLLAARPLK